MRHSRDSRPDRRLAGTVRRDWAARVAGLEAVAVAAVLLAGWSPWALAGGAPLLLGAAGVAAGRRGGVPLSRRIGAAVRFRSARRTAGRTRPDQVLAFTDRTGTTFGVVRSGGLFSVSLAVRADVAPDGGPGELPLAALAGVAADPGIPLHRVRVVVQQPGRQRLAPPGARRRRVWVTLSLEPGRCPEAVAARGGGPDGAMRALTTQAARLAVACSSAGVRLDPLGPDRVRAAVADCLLVAEPAEPGGVDGTEEWDRWAGTAGAHVTYWLSVVPPGLSEEDLLAALAEGPAETVTVAYELRRAGSTDARRILVRTTCPAGDPHRAEPLLHEAAGSLGARLRRLDGAHAAGLAATLPVVLDR